MAKPVVPPSVGVVAPPKFRHTFWWYVSRLLMLLSVMLFCVIIAAATMGKGLYDELQKTAPDLRVLLEKNRAEPSRVYAADGSVLAEFDTQERIFVPIQNLKVQRRRGVQFVTEPGRLIDATLSMEDARFYSHPGTDAKRIIGAMLANYEAGRVTQGGSTITEQLVKNVYLTNKRTMSRRLTTTMIALQLERKLSKDEILEAYLNEIPYGNRAYGCEAGAQTYFGKHASDLTISEAALLAGLPQAPTLLNPFKHYDRAAARQKLVLHEMWEKKRINWGQYQEALKDKDTEKLVAKRAAIVKEERENPTKWKAPYFVKYVRDYLRKNYGYDLNEPGLKVYTSLDPKLQKIAERALSQGVASHGSKLQGALVSIDPHTGQIVAMVGGRDPNPANDTFNRAVQAKRQPGSTMKPYIYAAAMEAGMTPTSTLVDSDLWVCGTSECPPNKRSKRRGGHEVRNDDRKHFGTMSLQEGLAQSNNVIATKLLLKVGIQTAIQKAHLMGIQSALDPYPSLALGVSDVSLLEHVSAYGVFATKGLRAEPTPVIKVENYSGDVLLEQPSQIRASRVLSQNAAGEMYGMLRNVVTNGTGRPVNRELPDMEIIGKTGTTSDNKDVWFIGASPELVTGVWMGYDTPKTLGNDSFGGTWSGPVFASYMRQAVPIWKNRPDKSMQKLIEDKRATEQQRYLAAQYKQYVRVRICKESGLLATKYCPDTEIRTFSAAGGAPQQFCDIHTRETTQPRSLDEGAAKAQAGDLGFDPARDNNGDSRNNGNNVPADDGFPPARDTPPLSSPPDNNTPPAYEGDNGVVVDDGSPQALDGFDPNAPVRRQKR